MTVENKSDAEPTENRSLNDDVLISFGEAGSETQATGSKSAIQAATPDAKPNAAMTNAIVPENELPRSDGTLSAFNVTQAIHSPGSTLWRTTRSEKDSPKNRSHHGSQSEA
jgi:hypothetical protein